ncbi:unnamed protein product, partial [Closterium sp. NIES-54]
GEGGLQVQRWLHQEERHLHCHLQAWLLEKREVCDGGQQYQVSLQGWIQQDEEGQVHALIPEAQMRGWRNRQQRCLRSTSHVADGSGTASSTCIPEPSILLSIKRSLSCFLFESTNAAARVHAGVYVLVI